MPVDRCVCKDTTFAKLVAEARVTGESIETVAERCEAGRRCGLCKPYVDAVARTGRTSFDVNDPDVLILSNGDIS
ncbi:MAG: hypothetical protein AAGB51_13680 [Planctomycetota bacterium]